MGLAVGETRMNLDAGIEKHAEWKLKLRTAIDKKETLDAATISKDNLCELGKWLHGEGKTAFSKHPSHGECLAKHAAFHVEAGKVAKLINEKKYSEAHAAIRLETPYAAASKAVTLAIVRLKQEAKL
jgi:methyl-accepting chemotaxis protein